jgi:hypothetical protein
MFLQKAIMVTETKPAVNRRQEIVNKKLRQFRETVGNNKICVNSLNLRGFGIKLVEYIKKGD